MATNPETMVRQLIALMQDVANILSVLPTLRLATRTLSHDRSIRSLPHRQSSRLANP